MWGIKHLAVLSTGEQVPNPRHLRRLPAVAPAAPARVPRAGPDRPRPPARVEPVEAGRATASAGARPGRQPARDGLHKLTTRLARRYGTVVIEDLNVSGMLLTGGWPATSPMPGSPNCAGNDLQNPLERRFISWWPTGGFPSSRRRVLPAVR